MKKIIVLLGVLLFLSSCTQSDSVDEKASNDGVNNEIVDDYTPKFVGSAKLSIGVNGDYQLSFKVNNKGTIYYIVQPYYEVTNYDVTASDIISGNGQEFIMFDSEGNKVENPQYVLSMNSVDVTDFEIDITVSGYKGDINGERPKDSDTMYGAVVWYVFRDIDGNYSNVLMISKH